MTRSNTPRIVEHQNTKASVKQIFLIAWLFEKFQDTATDQYNFEETHEYQNYIQIAYNLW